MSRGRYLTRRERRERTVTNRLSVLAGVVGLAMIAIGLWLMWTIPANLSTKAHGDALGVCLLITVAGFLGFAGALIGYEEGK